MIGSKNQDIISYIVKYSGTKAILLLFAEALFSIIIIFSIYLVLSFIFGSSFFYGTYRFFIYLYLIVAVLSLLTSFINYYRQRRMCKAYQIQVNDSDIIVTVSLKKRKFKFNFTDIKNYTIINCGYSIYEAIKLETKESKKILIYSSMKNYRKFKKQLKKYKILGIDYIHKPLGYTEENIY